MSFALNAIIYAVSDTLRYKEPKKITPQPHCQRYYGVVYLAEQQRPYGAKLFRSVARMRFAQRRKCVLSPASPRVSCSCSRGERVSQVDRGGPYIL